MELREFQEIRDQMDSKDHKDQQELKVPRETMEHKVNKDL